MKTPRVLVGLAVALAIVLWHWTRSSRPADSGLAPVSRIAQPSPKPVVAVRPAEAMPPMHWSRPEAAEHLRRYFAKEQLALELELEQARYRGHYWQAEPGAAELQAMETRRTEGLRRLTVEMNALLAEMCPGETGEPLALAPFFGPDHQAPNLAFLSDASREKMEAALLAGDPRETATAVLTGEELADYLRWNAPPSAALRNRLAGFDASEREFNAILEWQAAAGSDHESAARGQLADRLGPDRLRQFDRQNDPAVLTAMQDLRRLGLPLSEAEWLADFRRQASAQLQKSWSNPRLADVQKPADVAAMQTVFRAELAAQLKTSSETDDLMP